MEADAAGGGYGQRRATRAGGEIAQAIGSGAFAGVGSGDRRITDRETAGLRGYRSRHRQERQVGGQGSRGGGGREQRQRGGQQVTHHGSPFGCRRQAS